MKSVVQISFALVAVTALESPRRSADGAAPNYQNEIAPIFTKYCNGCHNADDAEGELALDAFSRLADGGANGPVVVAGKPDQSRLVRVLEKKAEPFMPPEGSEGPKPNEIELLKLWIKAGAKGPEGDPLPQKLVTPKIPTVGDVRQPVHSLGISPDGKWLAVARYGTVEVLTAEGHKPVAILAGLVGHVNEVGFSQDGKQLFAAAGEPGLYGEAVIWSTDDWKRQRVIRGHSDSLYSAALSPDGAVLATGSYDQKIKLWDTATGDERHTLDGHNGPVFDLAFHPTGKILGSASGDRTVKLWDVATGERLDTLNEPTKEQYAVAFDPKGRFVVGGGVDNRIRVWRIRRMGKEGTNPLVYARFAHEAPIIKLTFSPDSRLLISSGEDHALKLWETRQFTQRGTIGDQRDWVSALDVTPDSSTLIAGRLDGSLDQYELKRSVSSGPTADPITDTIDLPDGEDLETADPVKVAEVEPNDVPAAASELPVPGTATGVLWAKEEGGPDVDTFRFDAKQDDVWIIETNAARQKSPADTRIEVLHADGRPVQRLLLRAVRDSIITFRPIDSSQNKARLTNWEEMTLNQYLYMQGEVVKLFRYPQGPDSPFLFYTINGKRRLYFDTSATIHALFDPVYIVEPYEPGTDLIDNGLPVFPIDYANDDDAERKLGKDSRLTFSPPQDGTYLVRVTDTRGFGGPKFKYSLTVRPPKPDFKVTVSGKNATVPAGSGQRLTFKLDRIDNFEGDVKIDIANVPEGYHVPTPVVVQAGHLEARAVLHAAAGAKKLGKDEWDQVAITATADVNGREVTKDVGNLGEIKLGPEPKMVVTLEPDGPAASQADEIVIVPGTRTTAMLKIERNGFDGEIKFEVDNLPHGVIVDDIGLSGVLIRKGENRRRIFFRADDWVPETTRWIHATALGQGKQASRPVRFRVEFPESKK